MNNVGVDGIEAELHFSARIVPFQILHPNVGLRWGELWTTRSGPSTVRRTTLFVGRYAPRRLRDQDHAKSGEKLDAIPIALDERVRLARAHRHHGLLVWLQVWLEVRRLPGAAQDSSPANLMDSSRLTGLYNSI